jgi:hypothetical protein
MEISRAVKVLLPAAVSVENGYDATTDAIKAAGESSNAAKQW